MLSSCNQRINAYFIAVTEYGAAVRTGRNNYVIENYSNDIGEKVAVFFIRPHGLQQRLKGYALFPLRLEKINPDHHLKTMHLGHFFRGYIKDRPGGL